MERETLVFDTKDNKYNTRMETAFYIANFDIEAKQANYYIRNHWAIENSNHHVRDVSLKEDYSRIRRNPENIACLRSFALNVLRKNKVENIYGQMYDNSLCFDDLYSYKHFI